MSDVGTGEASRKPKVLVASFDGTAGYYDAMVRPQKTIYADREYRD
jgi:hypothetical protein